MGNKIVETKDGSFGLVVGFRIFKGQLEYAILIGAEKKSRWFKAERVLRYWDLENDRAFPAGPRVGAKRKETR